MGPKYGGLYNIVMARGQFFLIGPRREYEKVTGSSVILAQPVFTECTSCVRHQACTRTKGKNPAPLRRVQLGDNLNRTKTNNILEHRRQSLRSRQRVFCRMREICHLNNSCSVKKPEMKLRSMIGYHREQKQHESRLSGAP